MCHVMVTRCPYTDGAKVSKQGLYPSLSNLLDNTQKSLLFTVQLQSMQLCWPCLAHMPQRRLLTPSAGATLHFDGSNMCKLGLRGLWAVSDSTVLLGSEHVGDLRSLRNSKEPHLLPIPARPLYFSRPNLGRKPSLFVTQT